MGFTDFGKGVLNFDKNILTGQFLRDGVKSGLNQLTGANNAGAAGAAYGQAADQIDALAPKWQDLANTQWNQQMGGLQGALGQYGESQNLAQSLGNGYNPYSQNAYGVTGSQYLQPSQSSAYAGQQAYNYNRTSDTQNAANYGSSQLQMPSQMQGQYGQAQTNLGGPSYSQNAYGQMSPELGNMSQAQRLYAQSQNAWGNVGQGSQTQYNATTANQGQANRQMDQLVGSVDAQNAYRGGQLNQGLGRAASELGDQGGVAKYEGAAAGAYGQANAVQQFGQRQGANLEQTSGIEDFANQLSATGSNPYLDRQRQLGQDNINQQMARRGGFSSGGAMAALGNYNAAADAENFKYTADVLGQGQQAKLARLGQAQGLAQATTGENLSRGQAYQGLGQALSQEQIARQAAQLNATGMQQSSLGQMTGQQMQAAGMRDSSGQAWQGAANQAAQSAGQMQMAGLQGQQAAAQGADASQLARMQASYGMAQGADQSQLARQGMLGQMAGQTDAGQLARLQGAYGMIQGGDATRLAQNQFVGNELQIADNQRMAGLNNYMSAAGQAGQAQSAQDNAMFGRQFGIDQQQAGLYGGFYSNAGSAYGAAAGSGLNAQANAAQLRAQGALADAQGRQAANQAQMKLLGQIGGAVAGSFGGPAGAAAGYQIGGSLFGGGGGGGQYQPSYMQAPQLQYDPQMSWPSYMQQQQPYDQSAFYAPMNFQY